MKGITFASAKDVLEASYIAKTFENITKNRNKYGKAGITLPVPEFYVIYTGS